MKTLPNNILELVTLALDDLSACEADPNYLINMGEWHAPIRTFDGHESIECQVCFAGSVMARTLETPFNKETVPSEYAGLERHLLFLNDIRLGYLCFDDTGAYSPEGIGKSQSFHMPLYRDDPELLKRRILEVAKKLTDEGYHI